MVAIGRRSLRLWAACCACVLLPRGARGFRHASGEPRPRSSPDRRGPAPPPSTTREGRRDLRPSRAEEGPTIRTPPSPDATRRSAVVGAAASAASLLLPLLPPASPASAARGPNGLSLRTSPSGLRWADARVGSGDPPVAGSPCSIDYSMASTAGRFPLIYSTKDSGAPYRWTLGDGSTIPGLELAVLGSDAEGVPPMRPGGIRRAIVPQALGFDALVRDGDGLSPAAKNQRCVAGNEGSVGPIPPRDGGDGAYRRWYQFYCNPRIPYQPDLVLDVKLYGRRGTRRP